jgi:hypothetical protein
MIKSITEKLSELITDEDLTIAWGNANFSGELSNRDVLKYILLKYASGFGTGYTAYCIASELGLIYKDKIKLTKKGQEYLYFAFFQGNSF